MAWLDSGAQAQKHKYYKRIELPPTKEKEHNYRYFYSKAEYDSYANTQNNQNVEGIVQDATETVKNILDRVRDMTVSSISAADNLRKELVDTGKEVVTALVNKYREKVLDKNDAEPTEKTVPDNYHIDQKDNEKRHRSPYADPYDNILSDDQVQKELSKNVTWSSFCYQVGWDPKTSVSDEHKQELVQANFMLPGESWSDFAQRRGLVNPDTADNKPKSFSDLKRISSEVPDDIDQQAVNSYNLNRAGDYGIRIQDKTKDGYPDDIANIGYSQNCAYCTLAYEMRQRGYDVEAASVSTTTANDVEEIVRWYEGGEFKAFQRPAMRQLEREILKNNVDGARGQFCVTWTAGGGHSMVYEVRGSTVYIRDCQTNKEYKMSEYPYARYVDIALYMRTDNLKLTDRALVGVRNR